MLSSTWNYAFDQSSSGADDTVAREQSVLCGTAFFMGSGSQSLVRGCWRLFWAFWFTVASLYAVEMFGVHLLAMSQFGGETETAVWSNYLILQNGGDTSGFLQAHVGNADNWAKAATARICCGSPQSCFTTAGVDRWVDNITPAHAACCLHPTTFPAECSRFAAISTMPSTEFTISSNWAVASTMGWFGRDTVYCLPWDASFLRKNYEQVEMERAREYNTRSLLVCTNTNGPSVAFQSMNGGYKQYWGVIAVLLALCFLAFGMLNPRMGAANADLLPWLGVVHTVSGAPSQPRLLPIRIFLLVTWAICSVLAFVSTANARVFYMTPDGTIIANVPYTYVAGFFSGVLPNDLQGIPDSMAYWLCTCWFLAPFAIWAVPRDVGTLKSPKLQRLQQHVQAWKPILDIARGVWGNIDLILDIVVLAGLARIGHSRAVDHTFVFNVGDQTVKELAYLVCSKPFFSGNTAECRWQSIWTIPSSAYSVLIFLSVLILVWHCLVGVRRYQKSPSADIWVRLCEVPLLNMLAYGRELYHWVRRRQGKPDVAAEPEVTLGHVYNWHEDMDSLELSVILVEDVIQVGLSVVLAYVDRDDGAIASIVVSILSLLTCTGNVRSEAAKLSVAPSANHGNDKYCVVSTIVNDKQTGNFAIAPDASVGPFEPASQTHGSSVGFSTATTIQSQMHQQPIEVPSCDVLPTVAPPQLPPKPPTRLAPDLESPIECKLEPNITSLKVSKLRPPRPPPVPPRPQLAHGFGPGADTTAPERAPITEMDHGSIV